MAIDTLRQFFELSILDCSSWLMPQTQYSHEAALKECEELVQISSLKAFRQFISKTPRGYAIDHVGQFSTQAILLFHFLKSAGFRIVVMDSEPFQ